MICPKCGANARFKTYDSRPRDYGVRRLKTCPRCGQHIATVEVCQFTKESMTELAETQKRLDEYKERRDYLYGYENL